MSIIVRPNYGDFYANRLPAIDAIYFQAKELDESDAPWKQLFHIKKSKRMFEDVTGVSGFGLFTTVGEAEDLPAMTFVQLHDKRYTHIKYGGYWQVSEEMEDDDQDELIASLASAFARSARFTKEVSMSNVFNNGFTTELAADGQAIFDTHTLYSGATISNDAGATDFGIGAMQTAVNHFNTLTDDQGIRTKLRPTWIMGHPNMQWVFGEVLRSNYKPYVMDNEINVLSEKDFKEVYWAEITDTDAWFVGVAPKAVGGFGLRMYERKPFTVNTDFKIDNLTMRSAARFRFSRGAYDWRQVYGAEGA